MSKLSKAYDKEYMKMAMLKHEETFKHQVHELHRLYRVQMMLMKETEAEAKKTSLNANVEEWNAEDDEEAELELTLGTGYRGKKKKKKKKDDTSFTLDYGESFSWSSTESSSMKKVEQGKQDRSNQQLLWFLQC